MIKMYCLDGMEAMERGIYSIIRKNSGAEHNSPVTNLQAGKCTPEQCLDCGAVTTIGSLKHNCLFSGNKVEKINLFKCIVNKIPDASGEVFPVDSSQSSRMNKFPFPPVERIIQTMSMKLKLS